MTIPIPVAIDERESQFCVSIALQASDEERKQAGWPTGGVYSAEIVGAEQIGSAHIAEAIQYRALDRK